MLISLSSIGRISNTSGYPFCELEHMCDRQAVELWNVHMADIFALNGLAIAGAYLATMSQRNHRWVIKEHCSLLAEEAHRFIFPSKFILKGLGRYIHVTGLLSGYAVVVGHLCVECGVFFYF